MEILFILAFTLFVAFLIKKIVDSHRKGKNTTTQSRSNGVQVNPGETLDPTNPNDKYDGSVKPQ
jgi:flagellar biogenesis protein FliO